MSGLTARAAVRAEVPAADPDVPAARPGKPTPALRLPASNASRAAVDDALRLLAPALHARPLLVVSDFDGTIAAIQMDPWGAAVLPTARRALRRLAGSPGVHVALLSGRTADDLAVRVRVGGAEYLGNHGLERGTLPRRGRAEELRVEQDAAFAHFAVDAGRIADAVAELVAQPWLVVERKGPAVAFHYRSAPDLRTAGAAVAAGVDRADPEGRFQRYPGRRILELRPPGAVSKREAFAELLERRKPTAALILGDDRSDAEAFLVLREARAAGGLEGIAVAVHGHAEVPPGVASSADVVLASPRSAAALLARVAEAVARGAPSPPPTRE